MALTQAQVDACAKLKWKTAADIDTFFQTNGNFFKWYNARLSRHPAFADRGKVSVTEVRLARFKAFWDRIPDVFGHPEISGLEFAALMSVSMQETSGNLFENPEKVGTKAHPGISYAFDAIPNLKSSYNANVGLGNRTALTLFRDDPHYLAAHRTLPGFAAVAGGGSVDAGWGGSRWPANFSAAHFKKEDEALNGFVMQADFYKFRGRGVIQTTGRGNYRKIIEFILTDPGAAATPALQALRDTWNALPGATGPGKLDVIASSTSNTQWKSAFAEGLILAAGVHLHSKNNSDFLDIGRTAAKVNGGTKTKGSFFFMARKINGGDYPARVQPKMIAMAQAIAALAGAMPAPELAEGVAPAKRRKTAKKRKTTAKGRKKPAAKKRAARGAAKASRKARTKSARRRRKRSSR